MRIVSVTSDEGVLMYVNADAFIGMGVEKGVTKVVFAHDFEVSTHDSPSTVLRILGLETYVQNPEPEPDDALTARDRTAIEKTRTGPMGAGGLKMPSP